MITRFVAAYIAIAIAPSAPAQLPSTENTLPAFHVSGGLVWSDELGLEVEAGGQWQVGDSLRLRVSPANISLIDGDTPDGFYLDSSNDCRVSGSNQPAGRARGRIARRAGLFCPSPAWPLVGLPPAITGL